MKQLLAFAKDSAKKHFQALRKNSPVFSPSFLNDIHITRDFFQHVIYRGKNSRSPYEIMERILIFPFLNEIIQTGTIIETREEKNICFFEIEKKYKSYNISIIIMHKTDNPKYILLSCFKQKKEPIFG